jgi:hypothetical protein
MPRLLIAFPWQTHFERCGKVLKGGLGDLLGTFRGRTAATWAGSEDTAVDSALMCVVPRGLRVQLCGWVAPAL